MRRISGALSNLGYEVSDETVANVLLFPCSEPAEMGPVRCRERLGGLLKFYWREAA